MVSATSSSEISPTFSTTSYKCGSEASLRNLLRDVVRSFDLPRHSTCRTKADDADNRISNPQENLRKTRWCMTLEACLKVIATVFASESNEAMTCVCVPMFAVLTTLSVAPLLALRHS